MDALIVFGHGARDAAWAQPLYALRDATRARAPQLAVEVAFLEFQSPSLPEVIETLATRGCRDIAVLPVFWSSGGHVARDVPVLLEQARARHGVALSLLPTLSELPGLIDQIAALALGAVETRQGD